MPELEIIEDFVSPDRIIHEPESLESNNEEQAWNHCRKVLDSMRRDRRNGSEESVSMLLGRKHDPYLGMPPDALYDMIPVVFNDPLKAMKFLRIYALLHNSPFSYNVSTDLDDAVKAAGFFPPKAVIAFKLYEAAEWFRQMPQEERLKMMLQKGVVAKTLPDVIEPLLENAEKNEAPVIVYGPRDDTRYMNSYDSLRAAMIEENIFRAVQKGYGDHPNMKLRRDKDMRKAVEMLQGMFYAKD
ncbi:hypothetical protein GF345_04240 [Candidatus Woesearchaeota archaeon]|nr:hypothetical protein [Candidatus Woesearchaeota archaeon]